MKITLLVVGKTTDAHIEALLQEYQKRLVHYVPFNLTVIPRYNSQVKWHVMNKTLLILLQQCFDMGIGRLTYNKKSYFHIPRCCLICSYASLMARNLSVAC